jgi:hypothetical protein
MGKILSSRGEASVTDVSSEAARDFLWQEGGFSLFSTFEGSYDCLSVFNILGPEVEDLTDPHARSGHELKQKAIPGIWRPEGDFIDHILFKDLEMGHLSYPEELS